MMLEEIGTRISELRKEKDETQQELADAIGVTRSLVKAWETGARPIRCDDLINLSRHYGKSADYLLGLIGTDNATNDEKLRMVSEYTGLSNRAIDNICRSFVINKYSQNALPHELDKLLSSDDIHCLTKALYRLELSILELKHDMEPSNRQDADGNSYINADDLLSDFAQYRLSKFEAIETFSSILSVIYKTAEIENEYDSSLPVSWKEG